MIFATFVLICFFCLCLDGANHQFPVRTAVGDAGRRRDAHPTDRLREGREGVGGSLRHLADR